LTWVLLARDGVLLVLVAFVVREILRPSLDEVRTADDPDPGAGLFAESTTNRLLSRTAGQY
jgi:hypothetical protein